MAFLGSPSEESTAKKSPFEWIHPSLVLVKSEETTKSNSALEDVAHRITNFINAGLQDDRS